MAKRKVIIVGDSHIYAIQAALTKEADQHPAFEISALRLSTEKNGQTIGDIDLATLLSTAATLGPDDALVTTLRGNQYNTMGLMRHPKPFDIRIPGFPDLPDGSYEELIPYATASAYMLDSLRRGYGKQLARLAKVTSAPMLCLSVPSPKEDEAHIMNGAETYFRNAGIGDIGVSPAPLRLKLWELQSRALAKFCSELNITFLANPSGTRDDAGYLDRSYYADDATHANAAYGGLVLAQVAAALTR